MSTAAPEREDSTTITVEELDEAARAQAPPCDIQVPDLMYGPHAVRLLSVWGIGVSCGRPSVAVLHLRCTACGRHSQSWVCARCLDSFHRGGLSMSCCQARVTGGVS